MKDGKYLQNKPLKDKIKNRKVNKFRKISKFSTF